MLIDDVELVQKNSETYVEVREEWQIMCVDTTVETEKKEYKECCEECRVVQTYMNGNVKSIPEINELYCNECNESGEVGRIEQTWMYNEIEPNVKMVEAVSYCTIEYEAKEGKVGQFINLGHRKLLRTKQIMDECRGIGEGNMLDEFCGLGQDNPVRFINSGQQSVKELGKELNECDKISSATHQFDYPDLEWFLSSQASLVSYYDFLYLVKDRVWIDKWQRKG